MIIKDSEVKQTGINAFGKYLYCDLEFTLLLNDEGHHHVTGHTVGT
jgi:hypothetical protein